MKDYWDIVLDELLEKYQVSKDSEGLLKIHDLYETNFANILLGVGSFKLEAELERLCVMLQKHLGVYIENPCKLVVGKDRGCCSCTGYYEEIKNKAGNPERFMVEYGKKCILFEYSQNGSKCGKEGVL